MPDGIVIEAFYDGQCPLCLRLRRSFQRRDRRGRIRFVDVAAEGFDARSLGVSREALLERIHGRLPDGTVVAGVEVLRRLYAAVGFDRLVAISRWPGVSGLLDLGYRLVARSRLRLAGRCIDRACEVP